MRTGRMTRAEADDTIELFEQGAKAYEAEGYSVEALRLRDAAKLLTGERLTTVNRCPSIRERIRDERVQVSGFLAWQNKVATQD